MKNKFFSRSGPVVKGLMASIISLMLLSVFVLPNTAQASTMAGTTVSNTATVNYKSTGGTSFSGTSSVTVTVSLVKAAPVVAWVSQTPVASVGSPTNESTLVTQTYGIYSQANGVDQYTINTPITYTPSTIGAASVGTVPSAFYLGATTVAIQAATGQPVFYVPYDGTNDSQIGGATGIVATDKIYILGAVYTVSAIEEASSAGLPADFQGKVTKVTLTGNLSAGLNPGTLVPEYQTFEIPVTTGVFTAPDTTGSYAGVLTVQNSTPTNSGNATSSIYVSRASLTPLKEVSVGCTGTYVPTSANATPGQEVCYRITVTNASSSNTANTVSVTDVLSPYIAYKLASLTFTAGTSGLSAPTITYLDQTNASYTPVTGGGGAPSGYDALVSSWTAAFTGGTMAVSGSFTLVYRVWLY